MSKTKEYTNSEVTVVWEAEKCIHSGNCVKGLPSVFKPDEQPWININAASTDQLIETVKKCPSGALSFYINDAKNQASHSMETKVEVMKGGPLLVYGTLKVTHKDGKTEIKNRTTAFCRCGASTNKPYCDGAHTNTNFDA